MSGQFVVIVQVVTVGYVKFSGDVVPDTPITSALIAAHDESHVWDLVLSARAAFPIPMLKGAIMGREEKARAMRIVARDGDLTLTQRNCKNELRITIRAVTAATETQP